jgi:hypothetical protein
MKKRKMHKYLITSLLFAFLSTLYISCEAKNPLEKALQERKRYEVEVLSWAIVEGENIVANIRLTGPVRTSLKYITVRFDQYDNKKNIIKKDWIPFDLSELAGIGAKEFTLSLECGDVSVTQLAALIDYEPHTKDRKHLKELEGFF